MLAEALGLPQIAAVLILLQRGLEELHSQRNTQRLLNDGAHEEGRDYYPVVATAHVCWIASLAFLIPPNTPLQIVTLVMFLALQPIRYWIIGALGPYWTHRIISLPAAPNVAQGPYRFIRHPNYAVTVAETFLMPLAFGQVALAVILTAIWAVVLHYKMRLEDQALATRRATAVTQS